jgi:hypothetical protein
MKNINVNLIASKQLSEFGLNPKQWKIFKKSPNIYTIQNLNSKSLVLAGYWKKQNWKSIWLISV